MEAQPRSAAHPGAGEPCPFLQPQPVGCEAGGIRAAPPAAAARCASDEHERCPAYLVRLLSAQRPAFWTLREGLAFK